MTATLPTISGNVLRARMMDRARAERVPLTADIEIIATCNFNCVHCYIAPCAEREDVMSVESAGRIFRQLQEAGTMTVLLTGGEILTHKQFREIYELARAHGFKVLLNTNAYLIGPRWADYFARNRPGIISITLYGMTPETYERLTGIPRSYERVMRAIDLLVERDLPFELKCPAMTITQAEIPLMQEFARERGVRFRIDTNISPQEKGDLAPLQYQLSREQVTEVWEQMDPGLADFATYVKPRVDGSTLDNIYKCGGGRTIIHIDVHGGVSTCSTSRKAVGNILEEGLAPVWARMGEKVTRNYPKGHPCAECEFSRICTGCPALVEQLTGTPDGYVQMYCRMTHEKAFKLGYHPTGVPRTMSEGVPGHITTPEAKVRRMLPVLSFAP